MPAQEGLPSAAQYLTPRRYSCAPAVREVRVPSLVRRSSGGGHSTPLQCSLPGESQGQRSLAGCSPWGRTESDMTEQLSNKLLQHSFLCLPILGLYLVALGCWERCGLVEVVVLPPRSPGSVHRFSVVLLSGLGGVFLVPFSCSYSLSFQSCLTLCSPMDCSLPGSSVHRVFQAGVLEWGAIAFSILITRRK